MLIKMISLVILILKTLIISRKRWVIKINPKLKYFEIIMTFSYNNKKYI